jgi:hypothetical protein
MSTQIHPTTTPAPAVPAPAAPRRSRPRIAAIVVGATLALLGAGLATAGGSAVGVFGGDDTVDSERHSLSTSSNALVTEVTDLDGTDEVSDILGDPRVRLSVHTTGPKEGLFVGIGPAKDVERYLAGAPIEEVTDIDVDSFHLDRDPRGGAKRPARPGDQSFWVARATGSDAATLRWKVREGEYRIVVMNADGSRRVQADGDFGLTVPHLPAIAWSLLGGGLLLLAGGATAIVLGARTPRRHEPGA